MTERLYYTDSHRTDFTARVVAVAPDEQGRVAVTLDRTAFYPTGGGQPSDTGTLGAARVRECVDDESSGAIHHIIEGAAPAIGEEIQGRVDWPRRFDHLQQHTGQHILSQAFIRLFDAATRGFRIMERVSEIDIELSEPTSERIARAVEAANDIIWSNRPLTVRYVTAEEARRLPLRRDSARAGELRIVEIEDFDLSPCGGTHARRTGEVGMIAVRSWERAKGLTRLEFVAGARALADYRHVNATAREVAALFSVGRDDTPAAVSRLLEENKTLARRVRRLEADVRRIEAEEILSRSAVAGRDGVQIIGHVFDDRPAESMKDLALTLAARPRTIILFGSRGGGVGGGDNNDGARLVFVRSADAGGDMGALVREACAALEGRGGGRADFAQGGGSNSARLAGLIDDMVRRLRAE